MSANLSSATIKLNVPSGILSNAQQEAQRIGISLQDFIRMLMATYFARSESVRSISRDQVLLEKAKREIRAQKYTQVTSTAELKNYLASLES